MKWNVLARVATPLVIAIALTGCGKAASPPPQPEASAAAAELPVVGAEVRVLALGDSLFTGYGLDNGQSYPARLEAALRARGINARIANAGVSGDTSGGGAQRLKFALDGQPQPPTMVLISLGGNDMLRGLPPEQTRANLDAILTELHKRKIKIVLLGMLAAPNLGADYVGKFNPIYPALAKQHGAALVPFFLQPLVENPALVQGDRIHPTLAGIDALVVATVEQVAGAVPKQR
jgi:acyl-CoA thioesterase I